MDDTELEFLEQTMVHEEKAQAYINIVCIIMVLFLVEIKIDASIWNNPNNAGFNM